MTRVDEIEGRLKAATDDGDALTDANCPRWYQDVAWLIAEVKRLRDDWPGQNFVAAHEAIERAKSAESLALSLAEALGTTKRAFGGICLCGRGESCDVCSKTPAQYAALRAVDAALSDSRLVKMKGGE